MTQLSPPPRPGATYRDVCEAPPEMVAELVGGVLTLQPRPRPRHAIAASVLGAAINQAYHRGRGGPGGWWILIEPELHLGADVVVPDIAGWRRERLPQVPLDAPGIAVVPDWICEVLSPTTRTRDLTVKRALYGARGVAHLWLVDPEAQLLESFVLDEGAWRLADAVSGDQEVALAPFAATPLALADLWPAAEG